MRLSDKLDALLWNAAADRLPWPAATGVRLARFVYAVLRDAVIGNLPMRAMGLVYITILSVVPLIAISFSVLKGFGVHRQIQPLLYSFLAPLGDKGVDLTNQIIGFVENVKGDVLAGVGLILLFVTTISMAQKVEDSFNFIWRVEEPRGLAQRLSEYLSVILLGPVVMATALALIATVKSNAIVRALTGTEVLGETLLLIGQLAPYVVVVLGFSFIYWFLPNTRVRLSAALVGGVTGGGLWATAGVIFATFVANSAQAMTIYATFAIVIIALLWLYLCWLILLLGAQVAFYVQHPEYLRIGYRPVSLGSRQREQIALSVMVIVAEAFREGRPPPRMRDVAARIALPAVALSPAAKRLESGWLLLRTARDELIPARDPREIELAQVLAAAREPQATDLFPEGRWPRPVDALSAEIDGALARVVAGQNVYDLLPVEFAEPEPGTRD
jgi:membrane protein